MKQSKQKKKNLPSKRKSWNKTQPRVSGINRTTFSLTKEASAALRKLSKHHEISEPEVLEEAIAEKYAADLNV